MTLKATMLLTAAFAFLSALAPSAAQDSPSPSANTRGQTGPTYVQPLDPKTLREVQALYKRLIDAEDVKDLDTVREIVWKSPSAPRDLGQQQHDVLNRIAQPAEECRYFLQFLMFPIFRESCILASVHARDQ
jgi:hypothetical protein